MKDGIARYKTVVPARGSRRSSPHELPEIAREFLSFTLADEQYALPLAAVREILKPPPITEVPRAPGDVLGIISVRGRITTVLDLRRRLKMPEAPTDKHTRVLLVDVNDEILGLLVDQVMHVHRLNEDEMELAAVVGGDMSEYVLGIGRPRSGRGREQALAHQDDDILILLDPTPLLKR